VKKNRRWNQLEGHEGTKSRSLVSSGRARRDQVEPGSHTTTTHTQLQGLGEEKGNCQHMPPGTSMADHYRSCTTEWGWREDENRQPYKRPKAIVQANTKTQLDYQPTFHMKRKIVSGIIWRGTRGASPVVWYNLEGHEGTKSSQGATPQQPIHQLQGLGEEKGNCPHMPPGTSMAGITAHALPSGDGEKMEIGPATNDPRPSFGQTRKHNSITNPPFTRKEKPSLESSGGARQHQVPLAGIIWRGTGGPSRAREPHHNNPYTTPRNWRGEGELCPHMPPRTSMAGITAHAVLSGDGEKMKIGHPTNDPRPSFGQTRKHNSITNPPFTRKENRRWHHL